MKTLYGRWAAGGLIVIVLGVWPSLKQDRKALVQQNDAVQEQRWTSPETFVDSQPLVPLNAEETRVFDAFERWIEEYGGAASEPVEETGRHLAIQRREALASLIETDPERALRAAVSEEERRLLPASIREHLEEWVSGEARFEVFGALNDSEGEPRPTILRYVTIGGRTYRAFVYGRRTGQTTKFQIPLHGIVIGDAMAVAEEPVRVLGKTEAAEHFAAAAAEPLCPISGAPGEEQLAAQTGERVDFFCHAGHIEVLNDLVKSNEAGLGPESSMRALSTFWSGGTRSVLFMRITFPGGPRELISLEAADRVMQKANGFFQTNSYGRMALRWTITPTLVMPFPIESYRQMNVNDRFSRLLREARELARQAGFNTGEYDLDCVHTTREVIGGFGYIGAKGSAVHSEDAGTVCHELGHNLGLRHANGWRTSDGTIIGAGKNAEYENPFDTMGNGLQNLRPYNVSHKALLGWLPPTAIREVTSDGIYTLHPADVPTLAEGEVHALRIRKDAAREYWIETRHQIGNTPANGRIMLMWGPWSGGAGGSQLLDTTPRTEGGFYDAPLAARRPFYDLELGIKLRSEPPSNGSDSAVKVHVQRVHYFTSAAKAEQELSSGRTVEVQVRVASEGQYLLWARCQGAVIPLRILVDGQLEDGHLAESGGSSGTRWSRVLDEDGNVKTFTLGAGEHTVTVISNGEVDAILVTNDDADQLPPVFFRVPDQLAIGGSSIEVPFSIACAGGTVVTRLSASSSNQTLVPNENIRITGDAGDATMVVTPAAQPGTVTITLSAISSAGVMASTTFTLSIVGELQARLSQSYPGEVIQLQPRVYFDQLVLSKEMTLSGAEQAETILDGARQYSPLTIESNATVTLRNVVIRNGRGGGIRNRGTLRLIGCVIDQNDSFGKGGGIWNEPGGRLFIENSTISSNRASLEGGGICNEGTLVLVNSTVSGNRSSARSGGGIWNQGEMVSVHNTIVFNRAMGGGGLANAGEAELSSTLVAGNIADREGNPDIKGNFSSRGFNLVESSAGGRLAPASAYDILDREARIGPLQDNGGRTKTHALLEDSPAIDAGNSDGREYDQRGLARVFDVDRKPNAGDGSDIGAFELIVSESVDSLSNDLAQLAIIRRLDGVVTLTLSSSTPGTWALEVTEDLANWKELGILDASDGPVEMNDKIEDASATRIYRARKVSAGEPVTNVPAHN